MSIRIILFVCAYTAQAALICGMTAQSVFAQGFVSKDRDGATTYSNQPLEAAPTSGQVQVNPSGAEVTTYLLSGATLEEAQKDAALKAPFDQSSGKRVWGKTTWTAAWNYWTKQEKESCRMDVVSVRLKVTTQLPAWSVPKDGPAVDQCRWDLFAKSLRRQEDVRAAAVLARGREIERAILALSSRPGCESFATEVAALAQKLVEDG